MWFGLALWLGWIAIALAIGWLVRRHQRDIDGYYERDYRPPLVFQWRGPL